MTDKNIDVKLVEKLYKKYINKRASGKIYSERNNIRKDYFEETGVELSINKYDNIVRKFDIEQLYIESRGNLPYRPNLQHGVDKTKNEGLYYSSRYIELDVETKYKPSEIMLAHGYDPLHFIITNSKSTGSKIGTKGNDEQYFINTYKSVQVRLKEPGEFTLEDIDFMLNNSRIKPLAKREFKPRKSKQAFKMSLNDIHVNSDGYCREIILNKIDTMYDYCIKNEISKVYISAEGDFYHVADSKKQTVAGTQLTLVGDVYDMIEEGELLMRYIIDLFSEFELEIYWVLGNHSDVLEYMLFNKLKDLYKESKHISFFVDKSPYKAFVYGVQMITVSHGDINVKELQHIPSQRFPKLWNEAKYREVHLGHIHKESVQTFGNLIVRYQRTPKMTDEWEYYKGWYNDRTNIQAYTIDEEVGINHLHFF